MEWRFFKKPKIEVPCDPASPLFDHISRENHHSKKYMYITPFYK